MAQSNRQLLRIFFLFVALSVFLSADVPLSIAEIECNRFDVSNAFEQFLTDITIADATPPNDIAVVENIAYVAGYDRLVAYDTAPPYNMLNSVVFPGNTVRALKIAFSGSFAYVLTCESVEGLATFRWRVWQVNVSNMNITGSIVLGLNFVTPPTFPYLEMTSALLAVGDVAGSDPTRRLLYSVDSAQFANSVYVGQLSYPILAYAASQFCEMTPSSLVLWDYSNPWSRVQLCIIDNNSMGGTAIWCGVSAPWIYVTTSGYSVVPINLNVPSNPVIGVASQIPFKGNNLAIAPDAVYVATCPGQGIAKLSLTNPGAVSFVGAEIAAGILIDMDTVGAAPILLRAAEGTVAHLSWPNDEIFTAEPNIASTLSLLNIQNVQDSVLINGTLWVLTTTDNLNNLVGISLTDPSNPTILYNMLLPGGPYYDLEAGNANRLYIATTFRRVAEYNIAAPPQLIRYLTFSDLQLPPPAAVYKIQLHNETLFGLLQDTLNYPWIAAITNLESSLPTDWGAKGYSYLQTARAMYVYGGDNRVLIAGISIPGHCTDVYIDCCSVTHAMSVSEPPDQLGIVQIGAG